MQQAPLQQRLLDVTLELLEREGIQALTLRRIARLAGVSHGAPLRHFRSLAELRAEVAAHGFALLSASLLNASAQLPAGEGALARLRAAGRAYVDTAIANAGLFALMFRTGELDTMNENFSRESAAAFEHLVRQVRAAQDDGFHPERDTRALSVVVWSSVHGLATLWAQGAIQGPVPGSSLDSLVEIALETVLAAP